jgi:hypothetical protein
VSVRPGEIIVTLLLSPTRKKTPGVSKISAFPLPVVNDWPGFSSTDPIDLESSVSPPIDTLPST